MLVKNYLNGLIVNVDTSVVDQVWIKLRFLPSVLFGFVYIPPSDSTYYSHESFAVIHEKVNSENSNTGVFIVGDMNAKFGSAVREILRNSSVPDMLSYPVIRDDTPTPNDNAEILQTICTDNDLLVVNNLN